MAEARLRLFERRELPAFGGNCLPMTMYLAKLARSVLLPCLDDSPPGWAYEDRVLVMLAPTMREQVEGFYEGQGPDMAAVFEERVEPMDRLLVEQLRTRIASLSPALAEALRG
jgi:hypothetical protein